MMTLVIKKGALSWILESQVSRAFYLKKTLKIAQKTLLVLYCN